VRRVLRDARPINCCTRIEKTTHPSRKPLMISPCPLPPSAQPSPKHFYFAYGANMNSKTLARRGVGTLNSQPLDELRGQPAQLCEPRIGLSFQHRGGFSTLVSNQKQCEKVHKGGLVYCKPYGVIYSVTEKQLKALEKYEIGYCRTEMRVKIINSSIHVTAITFVSTLWTTLRHPVAPTARYRNIVLEGAIENNLPAHYVQWLHSIPTVDSKSAVHLPGYDDTLGELTAKLFAILCAVLMTLLSSFAIKH
jgi:hypothetical protein